MECQKWLLRPVPATCERRTAPLPKDRPGQASAVADARLQFWQAPGLAGTWQLLGHAARNSLRIKRLVSGLTNRICSAQSLLWRMSEDGLVSKAQRFQPVAADSVSGVLQIMQVRGGNDNDATMGTLSGYDAQSPAK